MIEFKQQTWEPSIGLKLDIYSIIQISMHILRQVSGSVAISLLIMPVGRYWI